MAHASTQAVAEIVTFKLAEGVEIDAFVASAAETRPLLEAFGGVKARFLTQDEDGLWTDVVIWSDRATALRAAEEVGQDPAFAPFGSKIDGSTVAMRHADILWTMPE